MEIITKILNIPQLEKSIKEIVAFFKQDKINQSVIMYGWECKTEEQYVDIEVPVSEIEDFIAKKQADGIFELGKSDLYVSDSEKTFKFTLCHESDIHFESDTSEMVEKMRQEWSDKGYEPYNARKNNDPNQSRIKPNIK